MTATPFVIPKIRVGTRYRLMTVEDIDSTRIREQLDNTGISAEELNDLSMLLGLNDGIARESFPVIELDGKTVICFPEYSVLARRANRLNAYQLHKRAFTLGAHDSRRNRTSTAPVDNVRDQGAKQGDE